MVGSVGGSKTEPGAAGYTLDDLYIFGITGPQPPDRILDHPGTYQVRRRHRENGKNHQPVRLSAKVYDKKRQEENIDRNPKHGLPQPGHDEVKGGIGKVMVYELKQGCVPFYHDAGWQL